MADDIRPAHYGGEGNPYEVIRVLEEWSPATAFHFCAGNVIKYTARAGKKGDTHADALRDHRKAAWYAGRAAEILERHPGVLPHLSPPRAPATDGQVREMADYIVEHIITDLAGHGCPRPKGARERWAEVARSAISVLVDP